MIIEVAICIIILLYPRLAMVDADAHSESVMADGPDQTKDVYIAKDVTEEVVHENDPADVVESEEDEIQIARNTDSAIVYRPDKDGDTLLHTAIILHKEQLITICIDKAPTPIGDWLSLPNKLFQTPLHLAVLTRQLDLVRKLVTSGADILSRDKDGNTPLHIACRDGAEDIVKQLIDIDQPEVQNIDVSSKVIVCDVGRQNAVAHNFSLVNFEGNTCLHLAALNGHRDIVDVLIAAGIDVNMTEGKNGRTVLHTACIRGDSELVRRLVNLRSCNINARTYDRLTAFDLGRIWSRDKSCMLLAAAGARYGDEVDSDSD